MSICSGAGTTTLYTGTASDLVPPDAAAPDGGAACARYTRSHPPRELAGVWRTEGRGEALRLEYAVKRLSRQGKLALLHQPETAADLLPALPPNRCRA